MNNVTDSKQTEQAPVLRESEIPRTKNQIRATAMADGVAARARWTLLKVEAKTLWDKVPVEDLAKAEGNFHKLAGLVQLYQRLSREESDRQVKEFFSKHSAAA